MLVSLKNPCQLRASFKRSSIFLAWRMTFVFRIFNFFFAGTNFPVNILFFVSQGHFPKILLNMDGQDIINIYFKISTLLTLFFGCSVEEYGVSLDRFSGRGLCGVVASLLCFGLWRKIDRMAVGTKVFVFV